MSQRIVEKYLKPKKYQTEQLRIGEESEVIDPRMKIDLLTRELILRYRLTNRITPVLSIPLAYNSQRGVFELIETPSLVTSRLQAYYYPTLPTETTPGYVDLAADEQHRLHVRISEITQPSNAETFTTTPLGANATYYGPARDFYYSRLTTFGVMGYADQPSASNGVYVQLSHDSTNWDYQGATTTLTAAGAVALAQVVVARFARVVWVNGANAQTVFRLGGRYMIAGSELPALSLAPPLSIEAICSVCGKDMTQTGDFFVENGKVYCPKCYSNKRWREVKNKAEWKRSLKAWRKITQGDELKRAKEHTPDDAEREVS